MRLAIIGRTRLLAEAAQHLASQGHEIGLVMTPFEDRTLADLAEEYHAEFIVDSKINSEPAVSKLQSSNCSLAISVNWITIIQERTLSCFKHGILNAHAGDLPRYRGNACPNWAILRNEPKVGLCVHKMVPELDAGPVYIKEFFGLTPETYIGDIYDWLGNRIPEMFAAAVEMISKGIAPSPQDSDPSHALRSYPRRPEDSRISWQQGAVEIHRLIRASSCPFDGAFCFLEDGRKVIIWRADIAEPVGQHIAMPGQPCEPIDGDPVIACGNGFLRLTDVSIDKSEINKSLRKRLV